MYRDGKNLVVYVLLELLQVLYVFPHTVFECSKSILIDPVLN